MLCNGAATARLLVFGSWLLQLAKQKSKKPPDLDGCGGCLGKPSFRQLAAAPGLRRSPSARVTTITTLPTSRSDDDASAEERSESKAEEADIGSRRVLRAIDFVKLVSAYIVRLLM
jgi:hypothetical protein